METRTKHYTVEFNGHTFHKTLELTESGAFKYGNGTIVILYHGNGDHDSFDTRYVRDIVENWDTWADEFMRDSHDPDAVITLDD